MNSTKTHQITSFNFFSRGNMLTNPLANAWLRHAFQAASRHETRPAPKKLFNVYALQNLFRGVKND